MFNVQMNSIPVENVVEGKCETDDQDHIRHPKKYQYPKENAYFDAGNVLDQKKIDAIAQHLASTLAKSGFAVVDNLLGPDTAKAITDIVHNWFAEDRFSNGRLAEPGKDSKMVRSDQVFWWHHEDSSSHPIGEMKPLKTLIGTMDTIVLAYNELLVDAPCDVDGKTKVQ